MVATLLALIALAGYLYGGYRFLLVWTARRVDRDIRAFPALARYPGEIERWRRDWVAAAVFPAVIWPLLLIAEFAVDRVARAVPLSSHEQELRIREQQRRIQELESELGIRQ